MATIKKQGKGYQITVSAGYDINGRQIRKYLTWVPEPGMTKRQLEKELNRQAVLFEEQVRDGNICDGSIRFKEFSELFMQRHANPNLKEKTSYEYQAKLVRINQAIGHIRLRDLKPAHLAAFYANLQEAGIRAGATTAVCKIDFAQWMKGHHTSMAELSRNTGVSLWSFKQMKARKKIAIENAAVIATAMNAQLEDVFLVIKDTTPLEPGTIHAYHRVVSAVLSKAAKWGYIKDNPAAKTDLPSLGDRSATYLDEDDARKLLELLQDEPIKWRTLITFDLLSGLRRSELLGLRWEDVNIDTQTIAVRQTWNYTPRKGTYASTPKTSKSRRPLKLPRSVFLLLLEYQRWQDEQRCAMGDAWEDIDGRVFTTELGAPIFPDSITAWFSKFIARSGLPKVTVHSLRHTYASLMIADGTPLVVVSKALGHAQPSTTANIYAHVIASAEAKAMETFDRFDDVVAVKKAE